MDTTNATPEYDASKLDLGSYGKTGLLAWGGFVTEEPLPELQADRGRRIYKQMRLQDPTIGGILFAIEMLSRQVDWRIDPADTSSLAAEIATHVEQCRLDMDITWPDTVAEIFSMLPYGWSMLEKLFKVRGGYQDDPRYRSKFDDGKIGWRKWSIRSQDTLFRWEIDDEGGVLGMWQMPAPDYVLRFVPMAKSLLFRTTARKGSPEGWSLLRSAWRPWYYKTKIENIEGIGIERDLAGLPVIHAPPELFGPNISADKQALFQTLQKIVVNIRRDEQQGVLMPLAYDENGHELYRLELLSTGGQRQINTNEVIQRYDTAIATSMLADFIRLGHEGVGSFALAENKTNLFGVALGAFLDSICSVVNEHAIPQLVMLNGWPPELAPKLMHGDIESIDLAQLGSYIQQLAQAGAPLFPNPELEAHLLKVAGLPVPGAA